MKSYSKIFLEFASLRNKLCCKHLLSRTAETK